MCKLPDLLPDELLESMEALLLALVVCSLVMFTESDGGLLS